MKEINKESGKVNPEKTRQKPSLLKRISLWVAGIAAAILILVLILFILVNTNPYLGS